mmetsp:Transcript_98683/g.318206  ORF Transcript_98683/g.318206 Transcript_98683/m.318206 type:complete len:350 (+) Transcript_98683:505-1554(+)
MLAHGAVLIQAEVGDAAILNEKLAQRTVAGGDFHLKLVGEPALHAALVRPEAVKPHERELCPHPSQGAGHGRTRTGAPRWDLVAGLPGVERIERARVLGVHEAQVPEGHAGEDWAEEVDLQLCGDLLSLLPCRVQRLHGSGRPGGGSEGCGGDGPRTQEPALSAPCCAEPVLCCGLSGRGCAYPGLLARARVPAPHDRRKRTQHRAVDALPETLRQLRPVAQRRALRPAGVEQLHHLPALKSAAAPNRATGVGPHEVPEVPKGRVGPFRPDDPGPQDAQRPREVGDLTRLKVPNLPGSLVRESLEEDTRIDVRLRKGHGGVGEVLRGVLMELPRALHRHGLHEAVMAHA